MRNHGINIFESQSEFTGTFTIGMAEDKVKETIKKTAEKLGVPYNMGDNKHEYWLSGNVGDKAYFICENEKLSKIEIPTWMAKEKFIGKYITDTDKHIGCDLGFFNLMGIEELSEESYKKSYMDFSKRIGNHAVLLDTEEKVMHILYAHWSGLILRMERYENEPELYIHLELGDYDVKDNQLVTPEARAFKVDFGSLRVDWNYLINTLE